MKFLKTRKGKAVVGIILAILVALGSFGVIEVPQIILDYLQDVKDAPVEESFRRIFTLV